MCCVAAQAFFFFFSKETNRLLLPPQLRQNEPAETSTSSEKDITLPNPCSNSRSHPIPQSPVSTCSISCSRSTPNSPLAPPRPLRRRSRQPRPLRRRCRQPRRRSRQPDIANKHAECCATPRGEVPIAPAPLSPRGGQLRGIPSAWGSSVASSLPPCDYHVWRTGH